MKPIKPAELLPHDRFRLTADSLTVYTCRFVEQVSAWGATTIGVDGGAEVHCEGRHDIYLEET